MSRRGCWLGVLFDRHSDHQSAAPPEVHVVARGVTLPGSSVPVVLLLGSAAEGVAGVQVGATVATTLVEQGVEHAEHERRLGRRLAPEHRRDAVRAVDRAVRITAVVLLEEVAERVAGGRRGVGGAEERLGRVRGFRVVGLREEEREDGRDLPAGEPLVREQQGHAVAVRGQRELPVVAGEVDVDDGPADGPVLVTHEQVDVVRSQAGDRRDLAGHEHEAPRREPEVIVAGDIGVQRLHLPGERGHALPQDDVVRVERAGACVGLDQPVDEVLDAVLRLAVRDLELLLPCGHPARLARLALPRLDDVAEGGDGREGGGRRLVDVGRGRVVGGHVGLGGCRAYADVFDLLGHVFSSNGE